MGPGVNETGNVSKMKVSLRRWSAVKSNLISRRRGGAQA
jgi:hypothetical protein